MINLTGPSIDMVLNKLIKGACHLPCFALLLLLVANAKILFEELASVAGTKQSNQAEKADKADRLTRQAGKAVRPAFFVLGLLLVLALPREFCSN